MPANNIAFQAAVTLAEGAKQTAITTARLTFESDVTHQPGAHQATYDAAIKAAEKAYHQAVAVAGDLYNKPVAAAEARNRLDWLNRRG